MANKSLSDTIKSEQSDKKRTSYAVEFGVFKQIEKYNEKLGTNINVMDLPPKDSKEYKDLFSALKMNCIEINAKDYRKVLGKNGKLLARVDSKTGRTLTGRVPAKKKDSKAEREMLN